MDPPPLHPQQYSDQSAFSETNATFSYPAQISPRYQSYTPHHAPIPSRESMASMVSSGNSHQSSLPPGAYMARQSPVIQQSPQIQMSPGVYTGHTYTNMDATQLHYQRLREIQHQRLLEHQRAAGQQAQRSVPMPMPMTNARTRYVTDRYGRLWTQEQYREWCRRKAMQTPVKQEVQPQLQDINKISPSMAIRSPQSPIFHQSGRQLTHQEHAALLAHRLTTTKHMSPSPNVGLRKQLQSPPMVSNTQKSFITDQQGRQWTREQWNEMVRRREAQKRHATPRKASSPVPTSTSAKLSTQPLEHKQCVKKPQKAQKQPLQQQAAKAEVARVLVAESPTTLEVDSSSMPPPALPTPQSIPSTQPPQPEEPAKNKAEIRGAGSTNEPYHLHLSALESGVTMGDIEIGTSIRDTMSSYLSAQETARNETMSQLVATLSTLPLYPVNSKTNINNNTMDPSHAAALGLPVDFNMRPVLDKVRNKWYNGYATFSGNEGVELLPLDERIVKGICTVDPDGSFRAPEDKAISEMRAKVLWELVMVRKWGMDSASVEKRGVV